MTTSSEPARIERVPALVEQFKGGLTAPICLTWEWTYACNLSCAHCLSSSGRRDPGELTTGEMRSVIDELRAMQVFYVNVGGGEPTVRPDFWELLDYAVANQVGVKFSTNGLRLDAGRAQRLAATDYVDVQVSLDGASRQVNDAVRGHGSYDMAMRAMENLAEAGFRNFKISVVMTRHNVPQLDEFAALADRFGAQLRITRLRPSGRGADVWPELHPTDQQQREIYRWLVDHGDRVLTGDSFFHLNALGATRAAGTEPLRRRPGGLPDRPGRGCLRLPVRHPRSVQGRHGARTGRIRRGVALRTAVRPAAHRNLGRSVPLLLGLRFLPGRMHGGEVLHRPAAGRTRSGVRQGTRRQRASWPGPRRAAAAGEGPLPPGPGRAAGHAGGACPGEALRLQSAGGHGVSTTLTEPIDLGPRRAPCRVMFGPHETNLGRRREISARHVAYYARRAAGGSGVIVTETASVHPSDWPYERAPLAAECGPGWARAVAACRPHGALVLAGLGHAGMQGSSAFSQSALWAPSRVPDAGSRELPMEMEGAEIDALVEGFAAAAAVAAGSGLDGVEINAGQYSLLRQFQSGLTNQRGDEYGQDRLLLTEQRAAHGAKGARGRAACSGCGCVATNWPPGPG